ncbi:MAG: hypothetical protein CVV22_09095 [Ignavibacteriae bacterium HGW-Ignavibacteriae-1]|jgi:DmsE family decaheme c-type cytochrome|nr:MAG: hypothetical protein CVV22_09095 [Ignavibacteriae bacterium HGW-Ignavibacteriae-1]
MKKMLITVFILLLLGITVLISTSNKSKFGTSAKEVNWVELNSGFKEATFVKDKNVCLSCHEESANKYKHTSHSRAFEFSKEGTLESKDCESCHGPRSKHIEDPDGSLTFTEEQYSKVCMQCHQDNSRMYWSGSIHKSSDVNCVTCHSVMEQKSDEFLLSKNSQTEVCSECHTDVKAKMNKTSHHPVKEGLMDCSSCHNAHGAPGTGMLVKGTINETCYTCHQDKRGPFTWEHAPVREDCSNCHEPHGSNNRNLLTTQNASLCVSCHQYGGHINQYRYNRVSTPYGNGCVNCHMTVHGSNHPSGAKFTR